MKRILRVGLVGFGAVAQMHLAAYWGLPQIEIAGITDTDPKRLAEIPGKFGMNIFSTLEEMLSHARLDIACVLTPAAFHEAVTLQCAQAGVHVLCEKPLATTLDACQRMIAGCSSHGVRLCYGASYRYLPAVIRAREMILNGDLGQIIIVKEHAIGGNGPENRKTLGFSHYPAGQPGGSGMGLVDHGIHLIDLFPWLMNTRTRTAFGRGNISGAAQGAEFALFEYENRAIGHLLYDDGTWPTDLPNEGIFSWGGGWDVNGPVAAGGWTAQPGCIHVHGTDGALRIFHYANELFHFAAHGVRKVRVLDQPSPAHFATQLLAFADSVLTGAPTPVPGEDGADACRTLLQIYATRA